MLLGFKFSDDEIIQLAGNCFVIYRQASFFLDVHIPPGSRSLEKASLGVPQVVPEDLYPAFLVDDGVDIMRVVHLAAVDDAELPKVILDSLRFD